jgi:hypothetical protein
MQRFGWWESWKVLGCLPYGGNDIAEQPAEVYDVLMLCETVYAECMKERQANA